MPANLTPEYEKAELRCRQALPSLTWHARFIAIRRSG
jgi:hypothetical protein